MTPGQAGPEGGSAEREREERRARLNQVLVALAKGPLALVGDEEAALRQLSEAAARALDVERVSLWLYDEGRTRIECTELYEKSRGRHTRGDRLTAADYPSYFAALDEERIIAAHEAHTDARTREFSASYLTPLGIVSMLDAPIRVEGHMIGVLCHEHTGAPRHWTPDEESFAASLADLVALTLEANERWNALHRAKQAAEEANRAKDRVLATLSHELRTPLTPVLAVLSRLEADPAVPGSVREALAMVRRNAELEARLIDDLLDHTRIVRGKLELHREAADLRRVIEHAIEICAQDIEADRIRLTVDLAPESHRVFGDPPRLSQVFWNLFKNAVKFTPPGGTIAVRSRREEEGGGRLVVEVSDTGIGIAPEALPRIFDAFEQADRGITRRFGGLGLGLAVSRAILEAHGGSLTASSAGSGHGATFIIRLPVGEPVPTPAEESPAPSAAPLSETTDRPLHLLLVEDHPDTADAMAELLRLLGHQVTVAGSVAKALAAADGRRFDLVISDLGLPDGSGLDLMRDLAAHHGLRGIALSGYGMDEDLRKSREAGFAAHLTKPVSLPALQAAIRRLAVEVDEAGRL
jgi:signal transduction histidine kinase/ActR/RegA family two-component response regulator